MERDGPHFSDGGVVTGILGARGSRRAGSVFLCCSGRAGVSRARPAAARIIRWRAAMRGAPAAPSTSMVRAG